MATATTSECARCPTGLRRALVVGTGLPQAVNDATNIARCLEQHACDQIVLEVRPEAATRAGLLTALDRIDSECQPGNDDVLVVYVSMHGAVDDVCGMAVLNPWLSEAAQSACDKELITMDEFRRSCLKLRCKNVLVVLDTCHAGEVLRSEIARDKRSKRRQQNRVFLSSCAGAQRSFAWEGDRNSQFTTLMLEMLQRQTVPLTTLSSASDHEHCSLANAETGATSWARQEARDGLAWSAWTLSRSLIVAYTDHDQHPQVEHCGEDFRLFSHEVEVAQPKLMKAELTAGMADVARNR